MSAPERVGRILDRVLAGLLETPADPDVVAIDAANAPAPLCVRCRASYAVRGGYCESCGYDLTPSSEADAA